MSMLLAHALFLSRMSMLHVHIADPFFRGHPIEHAARKCSMDIDIDKGIDTKMDVDIDMEIHY
jgi:hypothetical protein